MSNKEKEALANNVISCAESMIASNASEHLLIWAGIDGNFYFSATNRTWAMGALSRVGIMLEERERFDQRGLDAS